MTTIITEPVHSGQQLGHQEPAHCWLGAQTEGGLKQAHSARLRIRRPSPSATTHPAEREDSAGKDRLASHMGTLFSPQPLRALKIH